ncbi:DsbA family protein [Candidatus Nanobsidianus stetteri]|uniref:DsbA family protein n=1 Tax=Nanobsidianus stetteri TaxID=1294122 RepID=A0A2T9WKQ3_NANST|nr:thioredoxin domain-containing protein [Candidatus Nanobsidianus stetteri]MCC5447262.1 DsbA family protein [Candidatus Nanobsidianus stetteri]
MENEKEKNEEKKESNFNLNLEKSIIIGFIILAISIIIGAYIIANSISNIKVYGSSSSSSNELQAYLQTLPQVPLPNITNIDPVYGNPNNSNVIVYEFSDYACPYCDLFYLQTFPQIEQNYIDNGKIAWVYVNFPLYQIHPYANITSQYLTCVYTLYGFNTWEEFANWSWYNQMQNISWDTLSNQQDVYNVFNEEAQALGLNVNEIDSCVNSSEYYSQIYNEENYDASEYGIDGTPTFIIAVKTSSITFQTVQQVNNALNQLKQYGLSPSVYTTPDHNYIMFEFAGALPYSFFNNILQPLVSG